MKLNLFAFGLSAGIIRGFCVFLFGIRSVFYGPSEMFVNFFGKYYIGYNPGFWGALIGLARGFADAFIGGFIFAWLYNLFAKNSK